MRHTVLASDYDGTLATHGELHGATLAALQRLKDSGRRLLLVTGRTVDALRLMCPESDVFDLIVAENGALIYEPATKKTAQLAPPLPDNFASVCRAHGVHDMHVGQVIAATWDTYRHGVLSAIDALSLDLRLSYNKGSLMILPPGVDKASGLAAALKQIGARPAETVAMGDAENDIPLLDMCGVAVAVANALAIVKERADIVTLQTHGEGATEVLDALVADDLESLLRKRRAG